MKLDIFLSICQTEVDGFMPSEKVMFKNFFDQVKLADELGLGTAWVAETHLSCEIQKAGAQAVIPHFKGEIGLNTDILQLAQAVFSKTKNIHVGSAIRNIFCNGGPIAHAEAVQTALTVLNYSEIGGERQIDIGFASGRFDFSNRPYGINPRNDIENKNWGQVKSKALHMATEIFLRLLNGEALSSDDIEKQWLKELDYEVKPFWQFEKVGIIPKETEQKRLQLTLGSHDPDLQIKANKYRPVKVFNLSITPEKVIQETHERMQKHYHPSGGPWQRHYMPRTALIYIDPNGQKAKEQAKKAWENYWRAMEGTLDPKKVEEAVTNTLAGEPIELVDMLKAKYHKDDRLMLWFDFNNHDNEMIKSSMRLFMKEVAPKII